ncbi:MAG: hypothetical protein PHS92_00560 [Candidatus Gracilibacteria bacterium]|nr:hypothetical protein [Candidatus Gracilibacteria bacterium]
MQEIIIKIADFLQINPNNDVYILGVFLVFIIIYSILGITKIYESLFGIVLGISILIVLQTLLGYNGDNQYVLPFFSKTFLQFLISSSIYLILILSVLIPLNSGLNINEPRNPGVKVVVTLALSVIYTIFFFGILCGLIEKIYIFKYDNIFNFIKKIPAWNDFIAGSYIYALFIKNIHIIVVFGTIFVIYKLIFADIINALMNGFYISIKNMIASRGGGGGGGHDGGHEDMEEEDHGHGH